MLALDDEAVVDRVDVRFEGGEDLQFLGDCDGGDGAL